jgi:Anti-sigma regulatory factor (Ser/Thr protein kinase)
MLKQLKIKSEIINLRRVENAIDFLTSEIGISEDSYGKILIAVLEAVNNAIVHGNKADMKKQVAIDFKIEVKDLCVSVTDEGKGFKPGEVPDPTKPENIEALSGRGVFLMSRLADEIEFNRKGNSVKLTFKNILP